MKESNKHKLPNFLIVGAMKCGTTSLYNYLNQHPEIFLPKVKEPRFFTSSTLLKIEGKSYKFFRRCESEPYSTFENYQELFRNVKNEVVIGEASPHYLFTHKTTIPLIKKYLGENTKIIIILRDPTERAFSAYKHNLRENPFSKFRENLSFEEGLNSESSRLKQNNYPMMFFYKMLGLYYEQVKAYLDNFDNVFVCLNEELDSRREDLIKEIFDFLNVDTNYKPSLDTKYNESIIVKNNIFYNFLENTDHPIKKILRKILSPHISKDRLAKWINFLKKLNSDKRKLAINPDTRQYLKEYYKNDVLKLQKLIKKDLSNWLD